MKPSSISLPATIMAVLTTVLLAPAQARPPHEHGHPDPTNLKVLPKDFTGDQVHDLMHQWEADLGVTCKTCHVENPKDIAPNGRPRLNYADDGKQEKASARVMYKMLEEINVNYVSKIENSGLPVTCGTCHQGHLNPEPFNAEERKRPPQAQPPGADKPAIPK